MPLQQRPIFNCCSAPSGFVSSLSQALLSSPAAALPHHHADTLQRCGVVTGADLRRSSVASVSSAESASALGTVFGEN